MELKVGILKLNVIGVRVKIRETGKLEERNMDLFICAYLALLHEFFPLHAR